MGLVLQPELKAGDLFLVAASTLQGVRPWKNEPKRLLTYWYAARAAIQSNPTGTLFRDRIFARMGRRGNTGTKGGHVYPLGLKIQIHHRC